MFIRTGSFQRCLCVSWMLFYFLPTLNSHLWGQNFPGVGGTSLHGIARDANTHAPLSNIIVNVESQDSGNAAQAETDHSGKFDFQGLRAAVYIVSIKTPGYPAISERVDLSISGNNYLNFELQPNPPRAKSSEVPSSGTVNVNASVPEKARKEFEAGQRLLLSGKDARGISAKP